MNISFHIGCHKGKFRHWFHSGLYKLYTTCIISIQTWLFFNICSWLPFLYKPGPHPTNDISIEFETRPKFEMPWFKMYSADHNEILHVMTVLLLCPVQNFVVIGRVCFKLEHCKFWSNFKFDRNIDNGTGTKSSMSSCCLSSFQSYLSCFQVSQLHHPPQIKLSVICMHVPEQIWLSRPISQIDENLKMHLAVILIPPIQSGHRLTYVSIDLPLGHMQNVTHFWLIQAQGRIYVSVNKPSLVQIMACSLAGNKPLSETMLEYC